MSIVKEKYKDYLYLEVMPDQKKNVSFYIKQGFNVMEDGTAMNIVNEKINIKITKKNTYKILLILWVYFYMFFVEK